MATDQEASGSKDMPVGQRVVGEPFNPWRQACGFYPPDIVGRQLDLTDGQKRLYERGVRWAGKNGRFWYGFGTMAAELGKSERQVKRDMAALEERGLIRHVRRGKRQSNMYLFLYHQMFIGDGTSTSYHDPGEVTDLSGEVTSMVENEPGEVTSTSHEFRKSSLNYVRESSSVAVEPPPVEEVAEKENDDEAPFSPKEEETEQPALLDLIEIGQPADAGEDDPLMGTASLPRWYLEAAADKIHAAKCSDGAGNVDLTAHPRPDPRFTAKIIEPWRGRGTPALVDWVLSTVERRLGSKGRAAGPFVYGLFLKDSQTCAQAWIPDRPMSKAVANHLLDRKLRAQNAKAEEQRRILMETPMLVAEALRTLNSLDPSWQTGFRTPDRSRFMWLMTRRSPEITPAGLLDAAKRWQSCSICRNAGILGSPLNGTLAFCGCDIGQQEMAERGDGYIPGEVARVNATLSSKLVQACRELRMDFAADALDSGETSVTELETAVVVSIARSLQISIAEPQLSQALEYIGDRRNPRIIIAGKVAQTPPPLPPNVKPITQADFDRVIAERGQQPATNEPAHAGSVEFQAMPAVGEIQ